MPATVAVDILHDLMARSISAVPPATPARNQINNAAAPAQFATVLRTLQSSSSTLSLYLHIPFCPSRCLFCGCSTTVTHNLGEIDRYLDFLEREIKLVTACIGNAHPLSQLHLGGGTPNYLSEAQLVRLLAMIERNFSFTVESELSIECNPRRASAGQLDLLRGLGFDRISLGVQDLQPQVQRAMGRTQSPSLIKDVVHMAHDSGFQYITLDLMYGLPQQTPSSFQATLEQILELTPDRIACFAYQHNPLLRPHQHALATHMLPSAPAGLALFHQAVQCVTESGYTWIGPDYFALDCDELSLAQAEQRLHCNRIGYSTLPAAPLLALGIGQVSEIDAVCAYHADKISVWQDALDREQLPISRCQYLSADELQRRVIVRQLLCNLELPLTQINAADQNLLSAFAGYSEAGLVEITHKALCITPLGRYLLHRFCLDHALYPRWECFQ